jgi:hypothetical protein
LCAGCSGLQAARASLSTLVVVLAARRRLSLLLAPAAALAITACGGSGHRPAEPSPVPSAHHSQRGGVPARPGERYLIVMKRITAVADPWDDEIRVTTDGVARYRIYIGGHTNANGLAGRRITARRFARLRRLVRSARLKGSDRRGVRATPGGYYYTLHVRGEVVPTASGHLAPGVRPLVTSLDRLIDAMTSDVRY